MNEEIRHTTNKGKTGKYECESDYSDFLPALYILYKNLAQFFFHTLLANLLKQSYISCVISYEYLNKYKNICLRFFKNTIYIYAYNPLQSHKILGKYTSHTIACLAVFNLHMHFATHVLKIL